MKPQTLFTLGAAMLLTGFLNACGSGSGAKTECTRDANGECFKTTPTTSTDTPKPNQAKPATTDDIRKFQTELWVNIAAEKSSNDNAGCGGCHSETNKQSPMFARSDDINLAYVEVLDKVDHKNPAQSRLVTKVASGHHCWKADPIACADAMTIWITKWAGDVTTVANEVALKAPADKTIADVKAFPRDHSNTLFSSTVYPLLKDYCARCHSDTATTKQQPYFASSDMAAAYDAAKTKMRLDNPKESRFVLRLGSESHNCWSDCRDNALKMQEAIQQLADGLPSAKINPDLKVSKAVGLSDAFVLTSGGRVDTNLIAKYEFKSGKGTTAFDTSGVAPAADLTLIGNVAWSSAWGLKFKDSGRAQASTATSRKFYDFISASGEYSIETWVIPDNTTQGGNNNNPARIVSYSGSNEVRNFTLGQYLANYSFLNRSDKSDKNGLAELLAEKKLQASLQHVVATFKPREGRKIYVDGKLESSEEPSTQTDAVLQDWDNNFALVIGNEVTGSATKTNWSGNMRFLGIHKRAMSAADIAANYKVGVGAKYLLLFNISELLEDSACIHIKLDEKGKPELDSQGNEQKVGDCFIVFEVQQIDDYGYVFAKPFFTNLSGKTIASDISLRGIHIGVNGEEAPTGQVFANLNTALSASKIATTGETKGRQYLSALGTVIAAKNGPDSDLFFLSFDQLGSNHYNRIEPALPALEPPADPQKLVLQARTGLHTFAEINATLSALTGVLATTESVKKTYLKVEQQLPTLADANGFLAAQQMGITQLAVAYCTALVDNSSLAASYFAGFDMSESANTAFDTEGRAQVIEPLLAHLLAHEVADSGGKPNSPLAQQANPKVLRDELNSLIDKMAACANNQDCKATVTPKTVKATCAATLGSAVMLLH